MTVKTQPSAADLRAADEIVQVHDMAARKHDCPGFDCAICSLHGRGSQMAEIISRKMEPERREMLEALEAARKSLHTFLSVAYEWKLGKGAECQVCGELSTLNPDRSTIQLVHAAECSTAKAIAAERGAEAAIAHAKGKPA